MTTGAPLYQAYRSIWGWNWGSWGGLWGCKGSGRAAEGVCRSGEGCVEAKGGLREHWRDWDEGMDEMKGGCKGLEGFMVWDLDGWMAG